MSGSILRAARQYLCSDLPSKLLHLGGPVLSKTRPCSSCLTLLSPPTSRFTSCLVSPRQILFLHSIRFHRPDRSLWAPSALSSLAIADDPSCLASTATTSGSSLTYNNCSIGANSDSGCTYNVTNANSYGAGFAAAGGGVYVAEFASSGIKVWFLTVSGVDPTRVSPSIARRSLAHFHHFPNPHHPHAQVCERFLSNDCIILVIVP